jgi:phage-related protein
MSDVTTAPTDYAAMPLPDLQDSAQHAVQRENPVLASKMDGGYVVTRPRHTRRPRRTFSSGYTSFTDDQKKQVSDFFDQMHGGSDMFYWWNPADASWLLVRFTTDTTLAWKYSGAGGTHLWDVIFKVEEV